MDVDVDVDVLVAAGSGLSASTLRLSAPFDAGAAASGTSVMGVAGTAGVISGVAGVSAGISAMAVSDVSVMMRRGCEEGRMSYTRGERQWQKQSSPA